jgi:hypothetical protein
VLLQSKAYLKLQNIVNEIEELCDLRTVMVRELCECCVVCVMLRDVSMRRSFNRTHHICGEGVVRMVLRVVVWCGVVTCVLWCGVVTCVLWCGVVTCVLCALLSCRDSHHAGNTGSQTFKMECTFQLLFYLCWIKGIHFTHTYTHQFTGDREPINV